MNGDQLDLLQIAPIQVPPHSIADSIEDRFHLFHAWNPSVYEAMVTMTRRLIAGGATRVSVKMLMEVLRYEHGTTRGAEPWKLNNSFTSFYARLVVSDHPEWQDLIELRQQRVAA